MWGSMRCSEVSLQLNLGNTDICLQFFLILQWKARQRVFVVLFSSGSVVDLFYFGFVPQYCSEIS